MARLGTLCLCSCYFSAPDHPCDLREVLEPFWVSCVNQRCLFHFCLVTFY